MTNNIRNDTKHSECPSGIWELIVWRWVNFRCWIKTASKIQHKCWRAIRHERIRGARCMNKKIVDWKWQRQRKFSVFPFVPWVDWYELFCASRMASEYNSYSHNKKLYGKLHRLFALNTGFQQGNLALRSGRKLIRNDFHLVWTRFNAVLLPVNAWAAIQLDISHP